jgi:signal transduction histidine kinase
VRRLVAATLDRWGLEGTVDVATLLASELVTNAVRHAGTDIQVTIRRQAGRVRIAVTDRKTVWFEVAYRLEPAAPGV